MGKSCLYFLQIPSAYVKPDNLEGVHFMDRLNLNPSVFCAICSKQVDLRSAERDAYGKTVHRECHEFLYAVRPDDETYAA